MSAIPQAVFDADRYKETTRLPWDKAGVGAGFQPTAGG